MLFSGCDSLVERHACHGLLHMTSALKAYLAFSSSSFITRAKKIQKLGYCGAPPKATATVSVEGRGCLSVWWVTLCVMFDVMNPTHDWALQWMPPKLGASECLLSPLWRSVKGWLENEVTILSDIMNKQPRLYLDQVYNEIGRNFMRDPDLTQITNSETQTQISIINPSLLPSQIKVLES